MLVIMFASMLLSCSLFTGASTPEVNAPGASTTGALTSGATVPITPQKTNPPQFKPVTKTADEVATMFSKASTSEDVVAGLEAMFQQIGVGLYTADGVQIIAGAEKGPDDFYLYQGEAEMLAQAFIDGQQFPVDHLALFLGEVGYVDLNTMQPLSADQMLACLGDAVQRARLDPNAFTYRLVDLLGKAHKEPLDLTQSGLDPRTTYLDAIQLFLVLYDVLADNNVPQVNQSTPQGNQSTPQTNQSTPQANESTPQTNQVIQGSIKLASLSYQTNSSGPCSFPGIPDWARNAGFLTASIAAQGYKYGKLIGITGQALESLHDALEMLGYTVTLEPQKPTASTQWKQTPNETGRDVKFTAHVDFDLGKLNNLAKCGKLAGFAFPDQGAQKDISVVWTEAPILENQGVWQEADKTDANGDAVMIFSPAVEPRPGEGLKITDHGWVEARIMPRSSLNPRKVFDLLGTGPEFHTSVVGLEVSRHQAFSMKIGGTLTSSDGYVSIVFPTTTYPLTVGDYEITGRGNMTVKFGMRSLPPGCQSSVGAPMILDIVGKGLDPIAFTVSGLGKANFVIECQIGGQTVKIDSSKMPGAAPGYSVPTFGSSVNFSLPASDGAFYSLKADGYDGFIDFTLVGE
jgi:hypothetical protein